METHVFKQVNDNYSINIKCIYCDRPFTVSDLSKESLDNYLLFNKPFVVAFPNLSSMDLLSLEYHICKSCQISNLISKDYEKCRNIRRKY